ncbi:TolC family protein [Methylobacter sp.]|uniref:TolC family protein n=1 Tax=Methylobacter sp. TaxID=2051955 RepID=UPI0024882A04|nr:TolC family protein [Methylobacter sp.]MDI1276902.1 TolC family protein [Methylobacter sp.]MDI1359407.1 TolC family protein [Methylobacter sp.]
MSFLNLFRRLIPRLLLGNVVFFATLALSFADSTLVVEHHDPVESDATLSLSKVVDLTLEKYPDVTWLNSLEEEAAALAQRGNSWTAGASQAGLHFQEATSGTLHYIDAHVQVPLWNLGQRDAEQRTAKLAENSAMSQTAAVKLRVAGLIRAALWDMDLANIGYEQAKADLTLTDQLLTKVQRRVELGDLPRADLLLAQSESLQKRSVVTLAEAELMHTRKRYSSITQITKIPGDYQEKLADILKIQQSHPVLVAINSQIERKQAEVNAIKLVGSGQTAVAVGINSDQFTNDPRSNQTASFNIGVTVPFGGSAHLAPQVAAVNVELNKLIAEREQLSRVLEQAHHEAEHNLEVNRVELGIANELQQVAEDHLKMTQSSFSVGEINLMDLLRIQSRTQQAVLNAKQRAVMLQRDIALYNQAVGVTP